MNRAEELALKFLDAELSDDEDAEWTRLLAADPSAADAVNTLFAIEAALRAERRVDLAQAVLAQIQQAQGERLQHAVMTRISECNAALSRQAPAGHANGNAQRPRPASYMHWVNAAVAAAALIAIVAVALWKPAPRTGARPTQVAQSPDKKIDSPPPAPSERVLFSQDFNNGLPTGWTVGFFETKDLPPGVTGAVRQPSQPVNGRYGVHSPKYDATPLAEIQHGDVIHFTFRSDVSATVKLQVGLVLPETARFVNCESMYQSQAGQWQTLDLPIESFSATQVWENAAKVRCVSYAVGANDIGLVLTRFWITRTAH